MQHQEAELHKMLQIDIIERSNNNFLNPIGVVIKKERLAYA